MMVLHRARPCKRWHVTFRVVFGAAVAAMAAALGGCQWPWPARGPVSSIVLSGTVEAREIDLAFQVPGRIARLAVDEGSPVDPGQQVAGLDPGDYELALARARAEAEVSKATLALLEAGARPQEVRAAEAAVAQAEAQLEFARSEVRRVTRLISRQLAAQEQLDRARLQEDVARAALIQARQRLALLQEGARAEELDRARADYQARRQAVAAAQRRLSYVVLSSPAAGFITTRLAEAGEVIGAGQPVFRLARLDRPWVRVYVGEEDLSRIRLGQEAEVRVDGLPGRVFEGTVAFIAPMAEFTPKTVETRDLRTDLVYRVKVEVSNPGGVLKIGMPADVTIPLAGS